MERHSKRARTRLTQLFPEQYGEQKDEDVDWESEQKCVEVPYPLPKPPFRWLMIAKSNSGKTYTILQLLHGPYAGVFDEIYLFCPTLKHQPQWGSIAWHPDRIFDKVSFEIMEGMVEQWEADGHGIPAYKLPRRLIIVDDGACEEDFHDNDAGGVLNKLAMRGRHCNCSFLITSQTVKSVSRKVRENCDALCIWRSANEDALKDVYREFVGGGVGFKAFMEMYRKMAQVKYSFLFFNDTEQEIWLRFDQRLF